jgi:hypothetical protein
MNINFLCLVEPTQIGLYINDELQPQSPSVAINKKTLVLGQKYRLTCVASGGNPFPNVTLSGGNKVFTPSNMINTTSRADQSIFSPVNRTVSISVDWIMNSSYLGMPITCKAGVKNPMAISNSFIPLADNGTSQVLTDYS